ncbi:hypothetical protein RYD26_02025 [Pasteurellaceae bacterium LIM206]|nr:hypothetical protein [Pasteurellaceae bacterium LIM206]
MKTPEISTALWFLTILQIADQPVYKYFGVNFDVYRADRGIAAEVGVVIFWL